MIIRIRILIRIRVRIRVRIRIRFSGFGPYVSMVHKKELRRHCMYWGSVSSTKLRGFHTSDFVVMTFLQLSHVQI